MASEGDRHEPSDDALARSTAPTMPPPPDLRARVRELEVANEALCNVIEESAPLAWVANGDADAAHRWERKAVSIVKLARSSSG